MSMSNRHFWASLAFLGLLFLLMLAARVVLHDEGQLVAVGALVVFLTLATLAVAMGVT